MSGSAKTARRAPGAANPSRRSAAKSSSRTVNRSSSESSGRDRFEARRRAVERTDGLRRLRLVIGLAAVTSLAVGVVAFINSSWFDVDQIGVDGNERSGADAVIEASGVRIGDGLLEVDLDSAARSVELVPWVGTATVTRSWTGSIQISVVERPPSAVISAGPGFALVDDHGRQLEILDRRPEGYLPIRGIEGSGVAGEPAPDQILPVVALIEALPEDLSAGVVAVAVIDGDIHLELAGGGQANLGDGVALGSKLQALETVLARVDLSCLDTIDVRVPGAPVVTRTAELPPLDGTLPGTTANGPPRTSGEVGVGQEPDSAPVDC